jgi:two-component system, chemotaxis family, chemotaxis protein CheY
LTWSIAMNSDKKWRMMIVDDSMIVRMKIQDGHQVDDIEIVGEAANGKQALEMFRRLLPNLVTMDITMPELDGIGCIEAIVAINPDVRILVISALADKAIAIEAIKCGASGFINKPINERKLNDALVELISD